MSKSIAVGGAQNDGFVGDIVASSLTELQFQTQRSNSWILMDGRGVTGSKYNSLTGNTTIPDARGQFLRGKNNGRIDGKENPDGDLALGTQQSDAMQGHRHTYSAVMNGPDRTQGTVNPGNVGTGTTSDPVTDGTHGTPRTASETRSKNITVNYFIKIN